MMRLAVWIVVLSGSFCWAAAEDPALIPARDAQNRPALEKLVADAQASAAKSPKDAAAQYRAALTSSVLAEVALEQKDKVAAERAATTGVRDADAAIAIDGNNAEYYRVLGTLCGQVIPANVFAALSYGRRAKTAIEKAKQLNPKSAAVWIAEGVGNYYMPASFGGGPDPAIRSFQHALEIDPKSSEAWLWMGLAQRKKQENAQARASFEKSLALDPHRVWTKLQLDKTPPK